MNKASMLCATYIDSKKYKNNSKSRVRANKTSYDYFTTNFQS